MRIDCSIASLMTDAQARAALDTAVEAYGQLMAGTKVVTASYAQGDGPKSVTFTPASKGDLVAWIGQLRARLGLGPSRRPVYVNFR